MYDTDGFAVDESIIGAFTATPRTIPGDAVSITPTSFVVGDITKYTFEFTNENPIPNNAVIKVLIPEKITVVNPLDIAYDFSVETELTMNPDANCAINGQELTITGGFNNRLDAGSTVGFSLARLKNPSSMKSTASFEIETKTSDGYLIDVRRSDLRITMLNPGPLLVTFVLESNELEAITKYTFTITLNNPIPDDG